MLTKISQFASVLLERIRENMKKSVMLFTLLDLFFITTAALAQSEAKCPGTGSEVVLKHRTHAVKLTLGIDFVPVEDSDGSKRCLTLRELLKRLEEKFPQYYVMEILLR